MTDLKAYSVSETVSIKALLNAESVTIDAGNSITVGGKTYIVESFAQNETNTTFVDLDISARTADNATIAAYSET